jgi:hypothetical protein
LRVLAAENSRAPTEFGPSHDAAIVAAKAARRVCGTSMIDGRESSGSASSPFGFLAARGKVYAALALFNRLIAGPSGRSAAQ